jgi:hypothetical protein
MTPARILIAIIALLLVGAGAGISLFGLLRDPAARSLDVIPYSIDNLRLAVPLAYLRPGQPTRAGAVDRIDAIAAFPDMRAAGQSSTPEAAFQKRGDNRLVFVSVQKNDGAPDPADRPDQIYGRFLEPDTWDSPGGLVMRRFTANSPYADEELFLAPDNRQFSARCRKKTQGAESIGETCIWRFRRSGADIQIRFSPDLLSEWEALAYGVDALLKSWSPR